MRRNLIHEAADSLVDVRVSLFLTAADGATEENRQTASSPEAGAEQQGEREQRCFLFPV